MGVGKDLLGLKGQEIEHGTTSGGGGLGWARAGGPGPVLGLQRLPP